MAEKIILLFCVYPFVFIMYFLLKFESAPRKGYYFGITLYGEQGKSPEVAQITAEYQKQMRLMFWILFLLPLPMLLIPWFSIFMLLWMIWLIAGIFCFFLPFAKAHGKLKELKQEKGWRREGDSPVMTEMKQAGKIRRVKASQFIFPILLSLAAFLYGIFKLHGERLEALAIALGSIALITPLFFAVAVWMDRQKTEVISTDSEVNINYTRAKKNLWKNIWVACAWVNALYTVCTLFMLDERLQITGLFMAATIAYIVVISILFVMLLKKKKALDASYESRKDIEPIDDDGNWWWGMLYYNPHDKHSMVEKRHGTGMSLNMATPLGKGLAIFTGIILLAMPLICIWPILLEFVPIQLSVTDGKLVASQIREDYVIAEESIENLELLEVLPNLDRVSGTGMEELQKGTFRVPEEGRCQVFLNPENEVFLRFVADGVTYYVSGYDDAETLAVYEELTQ